MELDVGLQRIESERSYVKKTELINSQLKMTLFLTVYFYKWKSKTALNVLNEERKRYEHQRKIIFKELTRIREVVSAANSQERALLEGSISRGNDMSEDIVQLREQLASAAVIHKQNVEAGSNKLRSKSLPSSSVKISRKI